METACARIRSACPRSWRCRCPKQQQICNASCVRATGFASVVDYAREVEPLQAKLNAALASRRRTRRSVAAVTLKWMADESTSFARALRCIASSAKLFFPEEKATVCLFTDASDYGWAIIVT